MRLHGYAGRGMRPSGPATINVDSPQARGLIAWWPGTSNAPGNLFDRAQMTYTGSSAFWRPAPCVGEYGMAFRSEGAGASQVTAYASTRPYLNGLTDITIAFCGARWGATATSLGICSEGVTGGTHHYFIENNRIFIARSGGNVDFNPTTDPFVTRYEPSFYVLTSKPNNTRWYVNGHEDTTNVSASGTINSSASALTYVGRIHSGTGGATRYCEVDWWDVRYYNRALTPEEVWALYDPATRWDLYWAPSHRVFFDVGAVAGTPFVQTFVLN